MIKFLRLFSVAALALTIFAGTWPRVARAQDPKYTEDIRQQIQAAQRYFADKGFRETHNTLIKRQDKNQPASLTLTLRQGTEYAIIAFCDRDCDDINLEVFDDQNQLVAEDTTNDDKPIVIFTADHDGEYELKVTLPGCHANRFCHIGVAVFGQSQ